MAWAMAASAAFTAVSSYSASSSSASYSKAQARYNNKQNLKLAMREGQAVDTNIVRAKTEASSAIMDINKSSKETQSQARVQAAALGVGSGSYDSTLASAARDTNKAEASVSQALISELVGYSLQREDIGVKATNGQQSTNNGSNNALAALFAGGSSFISNGGLSLFNFSSKPASTSSAGSQSVSLNAFTGLGASRIGAKMFT
jgi:hypothetical protein